uniref:4-diphosphocytidyl-2-C-methyl-D-erythritol kinase n=1 Tax=Anthurium amnicola TaxID=1678845 RepID=A0A1D1YG06_9ARAE
MDLSVETHLEVNSAHHDEHHPLNSSHSPSRKRKLQPEQPLWPASKRQHPDRFIIYDRRSPAAHHLVPEETNDEAKTAPEFVEGPDQIEGSACKDGGSLLSPKILVPQYEPWASSSNPDEENAFKESLYSLDSRVIKHADTSKLLLPVNEDESNLETQCKNLGDRLPVFEVDDGEMEEECPDDDAIEELKLSCNKLGRNILGLSSASWRIEQDALPGNRKPTIDQEFAQYFSMFML